MINILIVDGKGGGIGSTIVERLAKENFGVKITAVGTNHFATMAMDKAGATEAATGENAVIYNASKSDYIVGGMGIVLGNSLAGELSPKMAQAISTSSAKKVLIPMNRCNAYVLGAGDKSISEYINDLIEFFRNEFKSL